MKTFEHIQYRKKSQILKNKCLNEMTQSVMFATPT